MKNNYLYDLKCCDMQKLSDYIDELYQAPKLRNLFWETTKQCNLSCKHCGSNCDYSASEDLTFDEICSFLKCFAKDFNPGEVMLSVTGGEPLLRPDLFDVMQYAADLGFIWGMTTNGTLLSYEIIQKMIKTNCKTISVSLDGLKDSHNALRGSDCFNTVVENIKLLMDSQGFNHVQITTVLHKQNFRELQDMYLLCKSLGVDSWRVINVEPIGRASRMEGDFLTSVEFKELFEFIREKRLKKPAFPITYGCSHYVTLEYEMNVRDYFFICGTGINVASVLHNGDIFPCLDIERRPELIQGNIKCDDFAEIWENGFKLFRQRRDKLNKECSACSEAHFCRGDSAHTWDFDNNAPKICLKREFESNTLF